MLVSEFEFIDWFAIALADKKCIASYRISVVVDMVIAIDLSDIVIYSCYTANYTSIQLSVYRANKKKVNPAFK